MRAQSRRVRARHVTAPLFVSISAASAKRSSASSNRPSVREQRSDEVGDRPVEVTFNANWSWNGASCSRSTAAVAWSPRPALMSAQLHIAASHRKS